MPAIYLGDAVFIEHDEVTNMQMMYTSDGVTKINVIFLESEVIEKLLRYLATQYDKDLLLRCLTR